MRRITRSSLPSSAAATPAAPATARSHVSIGTRRSGGGAAARSIHLIARGWAAFRSPGGGRTSTPVGAACEQVNAGESPRQAISDPNRKEGFAAVGGRRPGGTGPTPIGSNDPEGTQRAAPRARKRRGGGRMEQVRSRRRVAPRGRHDRLEARLPGPVAAAPPRR